MSRRPTSDERRAVVEAVRHYLGVDTWEVTRISHRSDRRVYRVGLPDREVVLKVLSSRKARSVGCDFAVDGLTRTGVPTPRVLAKDRSARNGPGRFFDRPFVILEQAPGVPLDAWLLQTRPKRADLERILLELGGHLRSIHSIRIPRGFGVIDDRGIGRHPSWKDYLAKSYVRRISGERVRVLATETLSGEGLISAEEARAIGELLGEDRAITRLAEPYLLHNDLTLKNVFIDPRRLGVTAILDLHNAIAGDPALELARFYYFYRGRGHFPPLLSGYGDRPAAADRRQHLYLLYVLLEKLSWLRGRESRFPGRVENDLALLRKTLASL